MALRPIRIGAMALAAPAISAAPRPPPKSRAKAAVSGHQRGGRERGRQSQQPKHSPNICVAADNSGTSGG